MKKILIIIIGLLLASSINAQKFTKLIWGDSLFTVPTYGFSLQDKSIVVPGYFIGDSDDFAFVLKWKDESLDYYLHPKVSDSMIIYQNVNKLNNLGFYVIGVKKRISMDTVYPVLFSYFDNNLNLVFEKQFYLPNYYVGNYYRSIQESPDTLLYAFTADRPDVQPYYKTKLGLLRLKSNGDTIQTVFHDFSGGILYSGTTVFDIKKIPMSQKYIVIAKIKEANLPFQRGIILNKDLSVDTIFSIPEPEGVHTLMYRGDLGYWVDDNSFITASDAFFDGKSDLTLYATHINLQGEVLNSVLLNQEGIQDQGAFSANPIGANDTSIYVLGHDMCLGCNEITDTAILEVYTLDASLNVLGYNVIENDGYYHSFGVTTNEDADLIIYGIKNVGDTYHSNLYLARIPRAELGLAVSVKNIPKAKQEGFAYPNPANNIIHFPIAKEYLEKGVQIQIHTLRGKTALSRPIQGVGNSIEININNLPQGIYVYKIIDENKVMSTGKFIKN